MLTPQLQLTPIARVIKKSSNLVHLPCYFKHGLRVLLGLSIGVSLAQAASFPAPGATTVYSDPNDSNISPNNLPSASRLTFK